MKFYGCCSSTDGLQILIKHYLRSISFATPLLQSDTELGQIQRLVIVELLLSLYYKPEFVPKCQTKYFIMISQVASR